MRRLIVNADDFGLTRGINRAVVDLHCAGALTSTTLMAAAPQFHEAVTLAKQQYTLGVGCHVVLVDGVPIAETASITSLLDSAQGPASLRRTLIEFVRDLYLGRIQSVHIEREATAQIQRIQQAGISVTHIDTHKHTHMFPSVLEAVARAAKSCGVRAIRNPFEPAWSVASTPNAGSARKFQVRLLNSFRRSFWRLIQEQEFSTTDGCLGVLATGTLDADALDSILGRIPEGTWEMVCHPAFLDNELRRTHTRLLESREIELAALQMLPTILERSPGDVELIQFAQLIQPANSAP